MFSQQKPNLIVGIQQTVRKQRNIGKYNAFSIENKKTSARTLFLIKIQCSMQINLAKLGLF